MGAGLGGALLSQAAFQSGPLGGPLAALAALAAMVAMVVVVVIDPVIGVSLGAIVFGEAFASGSLAAVQAAGLALTLTGVGLLATGEQRKPTIPAHDGAPSGSPETLEKESTLPG